MNTKLNQEGQLEPKFDQIVYLCGMRLKFVRFDDCRRVCAHCLLNGMSICQDVACNACEREDGLGGHFVIA